MTVYNVLTKETVLRVREVEANSKKEAGRLARTGVPPIVDHLSITKIAVIRIEDDEGEE